MTPHADRDRSEPYWPPAATREPRVRFPLDDGDTGVSLLPVAPAGTLLRCPACPAALADTRGGRLDHCDDGSHHYVPEATAPTHNHYAYRYAVCGAELRTLKPTPGLPDCEDCARLMAELEARETEGGA